ncbi:PLP-dependent transferase [Piedraia hortae CBS 480.64]|uniref:PLP-dependent transferase n=1 Tax=Piedraia hortae CBS 480.64 TaxID=1314780 RepID=A0A6A7C4G1_9PEZI|nr:PLP-dependent transferase [Piedraia hortae CBS 480.64]
MGEAMATLEGKLQEALEKRASQATLRTLSTGKYAVDFSSNDFLSLGSSEALRKKFLEEVQNAPGLGSGGSRLLDGNSAIAEGLEKRIAHFHGAERGLLCNSGFDANVGLFSCLPQVGDVIVYDEHIHASVHDGMRLSRAGERVAFRHNDVDALEEVLQGVAGRGKNVFVAVEALYSMDGDVAPLREMVRTLRKWKDVHLIVDEAHSTGVYGPNGRGLVSELGLEKDITVRLHTFGKALACNGAILLCSSTIRRYLINYARPLIYTTFLSFPNLAAIKASYAFLEEGRTVDAARRLRELTKELHSRLIDLRDGYPAATQLIHVPQERPNSPIFSVRSSEPKALAAYCQTKGIAVRGIVPPTVPPGTERVRICLHAGNTVEQIEFLVKTMGDWLEAARARL